jgi:hypothetical protein
VISLEPTTLLLLLFICSYSSSGVWCFPLGYCSATGTRGAASVALILLGPTGEIHVFSTELCCPSTCWWYLASGTVLHRLSLHLCCSWHRMVCDWGRGATPQPSHLVTEQEHTQSS